MSVQVLLGLLGEEVVARIPGSELPLLSRALIRAIEADPDVKARLTDAVMLEIEKRHLLNV